MSGVAADNTRILFGRIARSVWLGLGVACGIALTALLGAAAYHSHDQHRSFVYVIIAINILMLVPWQWRKLPEWLYASLAVARGFHWAINLGFAALGMLLLFHAHAPRRALAFAIVSVMFVLWAGAARRLTLPVHSRQD